MSRMGEKKEFTEAEKNRSFSDNLKKTLSDKLLFDEGSGARAHTEEQSTSNNEKIIGIPKSQYTVLSRANYQLQSQSKMVEELNTRVIKLETDRKNSQ